MRFLFKLQTWDCENTFSEKFCIFDATLVSAGVTLRRAFDDERRVADDVFGDRVAIVVRLGQLLVVFVPLERGLVAVDLTGELDLVVGEAVAFFGKVFGELVIGITF